MMKSISFVLAIALCIIVNPALAHDDGPGQQGTFKLPYRVRNFSDAVDGISLRVIGMQRPAEMADDMDPAAERQEYVIVSVELTCEPSRSQNCMVASWDFEVAGDDGIIYPNRVDEAENAFDLAPGEEGSGDIFALVSSDDTNLLLLFYHFPSIPYTFPIVFATESSDEPSAGIPISAAVGMIARDGPAYGLDFTGVFNRGEEVLAHGRNTDGSWLEIQFGWVPAALVEAEGDIMTLPVTSAFE